jgi:hypothetical protein
MRLNQRGDALTLAMGAAAFVAVSVMVMVGVVAYIDAKSRRIRLLNEMDGIELSMKQIFSNRDICRNALVSAPANNILAFPGVPAPNLLTYNFNIPRIRIGTGAGATIAHCWDNDPIGAGGCDQNPNAPIESIQFTLFNNANNNRVIEFQGDKTNRYRVYSGQVRVNFRANLGGLGTTMFGGAVQPRDFSVQMVVDMADDTPANGVADADLVMCYSALSPAQICAQMGGRIDPTDITGGRCIDMLGTCASKPQYVPYDCPASPPGDPIACRAAPGDPQLQWREVWMAEGFDANMQLRCRCSWVCSPLWDPANP